MGIFKKLFGKKKYSLVISWWWVRGFYALWILKALEELDIKKNISHIYWVSAWAIVGTYWSAWYSANWIFERFTAITLVHFKMINFLSRKSILKNDFVQNIFLEDLPDTFDELKIPMTIWTTDSLKGKYIPYKHWNLISPLLWSIAIPGIFPPVTYENKLLMDGGLINNFPIDLAKKDHPSQKIIGIFLNKFSEDQDIHSIFSTLSVSYEILMRAKYLEQFHLVDILFQRKLNIPIISNNKDIMKKIFDLGYKDAMKQFSDK